MGEFDVFLPASPRAQGRELTFVDKWAYLDGTPVSYAHLAGAVIEIKMRLLYFRGWEVAPRAGAGIEICCRCV